MFPWIGVTRRSAEPYKVQRWVVRRFAGLVSYSYLTYYDQDEEIELARLEWKYLLVFESARQVERLFGLKCGYGQGYYFFQSRDAKTALQFMGQHVTPTRTLEAAK